MTGNQRQGMPSVPHYYGDIVRVLMLCGAALMLIALVMAGATSPSAIAATIMLALVIVGFAALTNPLKRWIIGADVALSALMAGTFQTLAFFTYQGETPFGFLFCEAVALLFLAS